MKMVAASKFGKAEKDLKFARPYGSAAEVSAELHCTSCIAHLKYYFRIV